MDFEAKRVLRALQEEVMRRLDRIDAQAIRERFQLAEEEE